ncbi:O-antigen ligase family protein [Colwellia sp. KU-HH00111]|uniref:O-antigen ligase family protein n=1 Tax=Colwellia sp. KU-HH00111 TaxID=3127652 RepID=UPI0031073C3D
MSNFQRRIPIEEDKNPAFAFFLTLVFTFFTLVRPHELFQPLHGLPIIAILSALSVIVIILAHRPIQLVPQHYLLLGMFPVAALSGLLNGWFGEGVTEGTKYINSALIPLFIFSVVYTSAGRQKTYMWLSLLAAIIFVHNGHVQQNSGTSFGWAANSHYVEDGRITYIGILSDPNDLGMFFMMNIPFSLYFFRKSSGLGKLLGLLSCICLLYGIFMTNSRGSMLALAGVLGLYLLIRYGGPKAFIAGLTLAPPALFVVSAFRAVSSQEASAMGRLWAWWDGLEMLKANPLFGVGSNNFLEHHGRVAHNTYIQLAAELGLLGYMLWITTLFFTLFMAFSIITYAKKINLEEASEELKAEMALCSTCFYSLCGFAMTAFFLTRNFFIVYYMMAGITIASYLRLKKLNENQDYFIFTDILKKIIAIAIVIIIFIYVILKFTL